MNRIDELIDSLLRLFERLTLGGMGLLGALAWPALVFWIVWMLRDQLRYLIVNIREVEGPSGLKILLGEARAAARALAEANDRDDAENKEGHPSEEASVAPEGRAGTPEAAASGEVSEGQAGYVDSDSSSLEQERERPVTTSQEAKDWQEERRRRMLLARRRKTLMNEIAHGVHGPQWAQFLLMPLDAQVRRAAADIRGRRRTGDGPVSISDADFLNEEEFAMSEAGLFASMQTLHEEGIISTSWMASFVGLHQVAYQRTKLPSVDDYFDFEGTVTDLRDVLSRNLKGRRRESPEREN